MKPVRVLHVLRKLDRAGIETWLMHLVRHFDRREIAFDFLVQTSEPGAYDQEMIERGAKIFVCAHPHLPWLYGRNFLRVLREHGPYDVVHSHNYFFCGVDLRLAAQAGVKRRIAHIHPVRDLKERAPFRSLYRRVMSRWIARYSDYILAPSRATLDAFGSFVNLAEKQHAVVRNCVDVSAYSGRFDRADARRRLGLPQDRPVIAYVARFAPHKNHSFLLSVAKELAGLGIEAHFAAAGSDGETRGRFESEVAGRGSFSVFVDLAEIAPLLRASDIFVFPTLEEGFGTVAIEAAAAGLPVVASDLPAMREAVAPAGRRFLFAPGDAASAARSLREILETPALADQLSSDGKRWALEFNVDAVARQLEGLYAPAVSRRMESVGVG